MLTFSVHAEGLDAIGDIIADRCTKAETILAEQVRKDTRPFVPALTGSLDTRTRAEGNKVVYPGPYARYLYYGKVMVDPETGSAYAKKGGNKVLTDKNLVFTKSVHAEAQSHWFEASKAQNLSRWLRIFQKAVKHGKQT